MVVVIGIKWESAAVGILFGDVLGGEIKCAHQITPTAIQGMMYVVSLGMLFGHYHNQTSLSVV